MENKINMERILLGGIIAGIATILIGFAIHGVILARHYEYFQTTGAVLKEPRMVPLQMLAQLLSGIPMALLYAISRKHLGPGPKTALIVGLLIGLVSFPGAVAAYSYYDMGRMVPIMTFAGNMLECTMGTLIAGWLYRD